MSKNELRQSQRVIRRALGWLEATQEEAARIPDLCSHYKAPFLYATVGEQVRVRRYLDFITDRYLQPNGDFRTTPGEKGWGHLPGTPANRYIYPNGWLVVGFQRMGAYGVARRGLEFISRFQSKELGGFYSRYAIPREEVDRRYLDTSTSAAAGLALLA